LTPRSRTSRTGALIITMPNHRAALSLGDHVDFDPATQTYRESSAAPVKHSPSSAGCRTVIRLRAVWILQPDKFNSGSAGWFLVSCCAMEKMARTSCADGPEILARVEAREQNHSTALQATETGPASRGLSTRRLHGGLRLPRDLGKIPAKISTSTPERPWCVTPEFPMEPLLLHDD